jgi:hypothetical protein
VTPEELSPRQGKVLRYLCSKHRGSEPVTPDKFVIKIAWSDLPHTVMSAQATLERLTEFGLAVRSDGGYIATKAGLALMKEADKAKLWRSPPPPSVTNIFRNRSK